MLQGIFSSRIIPSNMLTLYSAQRLATLPETALRLADTAVVDMADNNREATVVASVVDDKEVRPATLAVVTATCQETAPKVKSATTVERLAT